LIRLPSRWLAAFHDACIIVTRVSALSIRGRWRSQEKSADHPDTASGDGKNTFEISR
jgi:hypothetical protein